MAGAVGAVKSTVTSNGAEAGPWLPAASVVLAVSEWLPSLRGSVVMEKLPSGAAPLPTAVPSESKIVTVLPASVVPTIVSVDSREKPLATTGAAPPLTEPIDAGGNGLGAMTGATSSCVVTGAGALAGVAVGVGAAGT